LQSGTRKIAEPSVLEVRPVITAMVSISNAFLTRRESAPKIKTLPGERRRERVISPEEEARYIAATSEPLASIATVLADTVCARRNAFDFDGKPLHGLTGAMAY